MARFLAEETLRDEKREISIDVSSVLEHLVESVMHKLAMRNHLPESILYRNKRGFQIPVAAWLRGKMRPLVEELLSPARLEKQGIFSPKPVERLMQEHFQGRSDHRKPLWTLLVLQLWLDAHPHAQIL